jgi:2-oxoglutarate ferredoxin oxidoreductase subunit gamma
MKTQKEITISGVGGQGMILCGTLIAEAAAVHEHKKATLSSEYGVETRGTFAKSDVIVSDEEIFFPDVTEPDLVVCLHPIAYARYSGKIGDALLLYNSDEVTPDEDAEGPQKGLAITQMAKELGNPQTANILTMGAIAGLTEVITPEGAKEAIRRFFKGKSDKVIALNEKAFDLGYEKGLELKKES